MKQQYDKKAELPKFAVGQKIWLHSPVVGPGNLKKLQNKYSGPYYITEKVSDCNFVIANCKTYKKSSHAIHADRLRAYHDPDDVEVRNTYTQQDDQEDQPEEQHDSDPEEVQAQQDREGEKEDEWYDAEKLLKIRKVKGKYEYLVKWKDADSEPSWIPECDVSEPLKIEFHVNWTLGGTKRKCVAKQRDDVSSAQITRL